MKPNVSLQQEVGVLEPLVLALACSFALAAIFDQSGPFDDEGLKRPRGVTRLLRAVRKHFALRGVVFSQSGVPQLPSLSPDLTRFDAMEKLVSLAMREAHHALKVSSPSATSRRRP